ncbi:sulfite exporter TauE/SafE family protein [Fulvivirga sp. M361]|nr:sulfite exporter TauE/SafE family protein [Fulvivirga sp. M361]TRX51288.1 sulfite exporter TauE/SafE family protein [Fulvivirga sp. M361]
MLASLAGIIIGVSKSGIKGIAMLAVALLAIAYGAKSSTGIMLPILIGADIIAVWYYHRHAQWSHLLKLMPWMAAGVLLGVWGGGVLSDEMFRHGMAVVILISVVIMVWWEKSSKRIPQSRSFGIVMGLSAGFATMVGNLAGAFSNIYFLAMRLPKDQFIGTAAWLFFMINLFKLPFHIWVWHTITYDSLLVSLRIYPAVLVGFFIGIRLVKLIREHNYRQMILLLTALGAILILFR